MRIIIQVFREDDIKRFRSGELVDVACGDNGCSTAGDENHECFPIPVPANDTFGNKECLKFVRSQEYLLDNCTLCESSIDKYL